MIEPNKDLLLHKILHSRDLTALEKRYLEGLVAAADWIPCSERLPEKGTKVLCACRADIYCVLKWTGDSWYENPTHDYMQGFVTHWLPLPDPPGGAPHVE